jgi:hypothetical protein
MLRSSSKLEEGIALWRNGKTNEASGIFEAIIREGSHDETAWFWYSYTRDTNQEKISALNRCLILFPNNETPRKALAALREQERIASQKAQEHITEKIKENSASTKLVPVSVQEAPDHGKGRSGNLPWILVSLGVCLLLFSSIAFITQYNSLQYRYRKLESNNQVITQNLVQLNRQYTALEEEKTGLTNQYNSLVEQHNSLSNDYSALLNQYSGLSEAHARLQSDYDSLDFKHSELIGKFDELSGEYRSLDAIALKPPFIFIHDRTVEMTFYDTDGQLIKWSTPFSGLETSIEKGNSTRQKMMEQGWYTTEVYTNDGEKLGIRNFSIFVNPQPFEKVMPKIYNSSTNAYEFVYRTWNIIKQLSNYASEDYETPRYPYETLLAGGGDCEDLSILFASLIQAAPVNWYVDLVYVDADSFLDPQTHNHVLVYIDTGEETFLVETTNDQEMLPYNDGVVGWLASNLDSLSEDSYYPVYLH